MPDVNYTTYDQVGQKEDVSDVITMISPTDTPFQAAIKDDKMDARLHQWQQDSLAAPATNKKVEGADRSTSARTPTVMRSNYSQILDDAFQVSGTAEAIDTYGRDSEIAYQTAKSGKQLKRDLEYAFVGDTAQNAAVGDASSTARAMGNAWGNDVAGNPLIASAMTLSNSGTARALTEDLVLEAHQLAFASGSDPTILMVTTSDAQVVAGFAGASGRYRQIDGGSKKLVNAVDLYVSPYGELKVVINRFMRNYDVGVQNGECLIFDPDMWKKLWLRKWFREKLAKTGDAERFQIVGEYSLKHRNYSATARITDLNGT